MPPSGPSEDRYGIRDAAAVLMYYRRKVARRWRSGPAGRQWAWRLDGRPVTLQALEDEAERYERLRYRRTPR